MTDPRIYNFYNGMRRFFDLWWMKNYRQVYLTDEELGHALICSGSISLEAIKGWESRHTGYTLPLNWSDDRSPQSVNKQT